MKIQTCHRKHCGAFGAIIPAIRVPLTDAPEGTPAIKLLIPMQLCEYHFKQAKVGEFLFPKNRRTVNNQCKRMRWPKPDFAKAWLEPATQDD